ncbi:hypothetical protein HN587_04050 [Candidatus Woesearchaeota archaeon]|jgi:hypothetical protein|nr:hypothetical protein [Candidatus Woesearchaeota archaeon]
MKKMTLFILFFLVLLFSIGITSLAYSSYKVVEKSTMLYDFKVNGSIVGINVDPDAIHFGMVPGGSSSERKVFVTNSHDVPVNVKIYAVGDYPDLVIPRNNSFSLEPLEKFPLFFRVFPPIGIEDGYYSGKIIIIFERK